MATMYDPKTIKYTIEYNITNHYVSITSDTGESVMVYGKPNGLRTLDRMIRADMAKQRKDIE